MLHSQLHLHAALTGQTGKGWEPSKCNDLPENGQHWIVQYFRLIFKWFGRPRCRWEDNIKMDLQEVGWDGVTWIDMAQDRDRWRALVNAVMNLPSSIKCGEFLD
jgi:hypothetical protein